MGNRNRGLSAPGCKAPSRVGLRNHGRDSFAATVKRLISPQQDSNTLQFNMIDCGAMT